MLNEESIRLSEASRPDLSSPRLRATLTGDQLSVAVLAESRCVVQFAERVTTRERVRRQPSPGALAGEAVLAGVGIGVGIGAWRGSEGGSVSGRDVVGVLALTAGLGAAAALAIDAGRYSRTESVETETTPEAHARVAPCKGRGKRASRVELVSVTGRHFSVPLDGHGRGRLRLPEDVWLDGRVDFDVRVDSVPVERLVLERPR